MAPPNIDIWIFIGHNNGSLAARTADQRRRPGRSQKYLYGLKIIFRCIYQYFMYSYHVSRGSLIKLWIEMIFVRPKLFDHAMHWRESLRSFDKQDINSFNPRRGSSVFPVESPGEHKKGFRIKMTVIGPPPQVKMFYQHLERHFHKLSLRLHI